jgi:hypothetical protein
MPSNCYHTRWLLSNIIRTDLSFLLTPKLQRFSTVIYCVIKSSWLFSDADFAMIQTLQWFSVSSHHTDLSVILPFVSPCLFWTTYYGISLYKDMSSRNANSDYTHHLFIYMQPTHYAFENASLPSPHMEWASILPLSTASKDDHLFCADHVWKEVLGVSWHWHKWLRRLLYIDFINWWFHLQYC